MRQWVKCVTSFCCFAFSWLLMMWSIFACPIDHLYVYFVKCPFKFCQLNFFYCLTGLYELHIQSALYMQFCQENTLVIVNTLIQQQKRWPSPDGQHWNQRDYTLCSQRWTSIQSAKTRPEADYGSDHELLIAKFRLKLKKVGKTTRPFRYDLNQIPYYYTVEGTNRFKALDLIDRVSEELWVEVHDIVQEAEIKTTPKKKKGKKGKMVVWGGCTNSGEKKISERQRRKGKIYPFEYRVPKTSKER